MLDKYDLQTPGQLVHTEAFDVDFCPKSPSEGVQ